MARHSCLAGVQTGVPDVYEVINILVKNPWIGCKIILQLRPNHHFLRTAVLKDLSRVTKDIVYAM